MIKTIEIDGGARDGVQAGGALWTITPPTRDVGPERLLRVDAVTGEILDSVKVGLLHGGLAADADSVWLVNQSGACVVYSCGMGGDDPPRQPRFPRENSLFRVDAITGRVLARIRLPGPFDVAVSGDAVWVTVLGNSREGSKLVKVDRTSNRIVAEVPLPGSGASFVSATPEAVWATSHALEGEPFGMWRITRVEPRTLAIVTSIAFSSGDPVAVVATADQVWVGDAAEHKIIAIDPRSNRATGAIAGVNIYRMAADSGRLWVVEGESPVYRVDLDGMPVVVPLQGVSLEPNGVMVGPEGTWVSGAKGLTKIGVG